MSPEAKKWLFDVRESCAAIESFVKGRSLADYLNQEMMRAATERKFEIIGEAMTKLRDRAPEVFSTITEGYAIIGFRNRLIHGYKTTRRRQGLTHDKRY